MNQTKIDRINALAKASKERELTAEEREEQTMLRNEFRRSVIGNLTGQLDHTVIVRPDGSRAEVKKKINQEQTDEAKTQQACVLHRPTKWESPVRKILKVLAGTHRMEHMESIWLPHHSCRLL